MHFTEMLYLAHYEVYCIWYDEYFVVHNAELIAYKLQSVTDHKIHDENYVVSDIMQILV